MPKDICALRDKFDSIELASLTTVAKRKTFRHLSIESNISIEFFSCPKNLCIKLNLYLHFYSYFYVDSSNTILRV